MTIVLDTHVWLWWAARPERLSTAARRAIDDADRIGVCTLSAWEVAMLVVGRRIELDRDIGMWVRQALAAPRVEALERSPQAAIASALLEPDAFPGDPIDRMIYATARELGAKLVTRDRAIRAYDEQTAVW